MVREGHSAAPFLDTKLLECLPGVPAHPKARFWRFAPLDLGRRYDPRNGACYYSELGHLETCVPLCAGPRDLVAYTGATRRRVREAQRACNEAAADGSHIVVLFECRCGRGPDAVSIGTHYNYLVPSETWYRICSGQYPAVTGFVASAMAGIQLVAGQGCVGAANRRPQVAFQIAQRSDFITQVACLDTMGRQGRGLINTRDEAECGPVDSMRNPWARFHHICLDFPLNEHALFVTSGIVSALLAAVTEETPVSHLILADPVNALWQWSHDPTLTTRAELADGTFVTSDQYLAKLVALLIQVSSERGLDQYVLELAAVLDAAAALSDAFLRKDWDFLSPRIDWVNKRRILSHAIANGQGLNWASPHIAMLDQLYGSADPEDSLFLAEQEAGATIREVEDGAIMRAMDSPPEGTRSWGHAMFLRRVANDPEYAVVRVNWDETVVRRNRDGKTYSVWFADPHFLRRQDCEHILASPSTDEIIQSFEMLGAAHIPHDRKGACGNHAGLDPAATERNAI